MQTYKFNSLEQKLRDDLFPEYKLGMWYVYLLTDSNRSQIHAGFCSDLHELLQMIRQTERLGPRAVCGSGEYVSSRLVFIEAFRSAIQAERKLSDISRFTRMQKERLIRKDNPDWKDLRIALLIALQGMDAQGAALQGMGAGATLQGMGAGAATQFPYPS